MATESEDPEVALAWLLHERIQKLISIQPESPAGLPPLAAWIDSYMFTFTQWGKSSVIDMQGVVDLQDRVDSGRGKVFGAYIDGGALLYDMPRSADYCRKHIIPLLDRALILDDLAAI